MSKRPAASDSAKATKPSDENICNLIADSAARNGQSLFCKYKKNDKPPKTTPHTRTSLKPGR